MIIPIQLKQYEQDKGTDLFASLEKMEEMTLAALNIKEANLEEFVRKNIGLLFPDEETLLIVGQQVRNLEGGRSDLVAVDSDGNIVLLELKRDALDMVARKEAFEFQAVRYAANYALISSTQDLVQRLFAPYVNKYYAEFASKHPTGLNASEIASREILSFLEANQADKDFNHSQRIVLIASSFDPQTLSASAWLAKSGIDIRCISLAPVKYAQHYFLSVEQLIPPPALKDFFVEVVDTTKTSSKPSTSKSQVARQSLPQIAQMMEWNLIAPGDKLHITKYPSEIATIKDKNQVIYDGKAMTFNAWGQKVTGWSAINIYEWAVVEAKANKTLDELRREKVQELEQVASEITISDAEA
jgi:hypothetical protein